MTESYGANPLRKNEPPKVEVNWIHLKGFTNSSNGSPMDGFSSTPLREVAGGRLGVVFGVVD